MIAPSRTTTIFTVVDPASTPIPSRRGMLRET
jgi:hypothetical protein